MELHGAALDRSLEIIVGNGEAGARIIDEMARDSLVGSVLVLHGLHPDDLETRITKSVERLQAKLLREGSQVELLAIEEGSVEFESYPTRAFVRLDQQDAQVVGGRRNLQRSS